MAASDTRVMRSARGLSTHTWILHDGTPRRVRAIFTVGDTRVIHLFGVSAPVRCSLDTMFEVVSR